MAKTIFPTKNFDWEYGGIKFETDESGNINKYIRIPQGCWMDINYNLFGTK